MSYADLSGLAERAGEAELRQIADRDRDGTPDPDVIAAALDDADAVINGYVRTRYSLPLSPVPALVATWAVSIARYVLHRNGAPEHVEKDYKDAIAALKDVSRGQIVLTDVAGDAAPAVGGGQVLSDHPATVFTPERLRGW
jgi:phage gp36-like protein